MCSTRMVTARTTARTGVRLLREPAMFGPISRLDSKFSGAAAPGNSNPTQANRTTALASPPLASTKNGARHQKSSVEVGMLIVTPNQGCIHRNPNWVRTKPAPNMNIDARARTIAMVMGVVPHQGFDRRLKIVAPTIADNAEVANSDFDKN